LRDRQVFAIISSGYGGGFGFYRQSDQLRREDMKNGHAAAIVLAGALVLPLCIMGAAQNSPQNAAPARPGLVILDFKPAMDDLMTMLVQPRHIKLYYAGQAKNWTLAGFQVNELRGALARIGRTIPNYRNINVDTAVAAIFADKLKAVDAAVKAADSAQFTAAYGEMTAACNDCHKGMEHPFLVIKVPDAPNYPDQEFRPLEQH
jgi:hypothetical protein